ncbi:MAG: hypothetical protein SFV19_08640 [Rhodospirillaceae bacterium]|nr:hypothetical protein [Rhodospirillaceae bacterium]
MHRSPRRHAIVTVALLALGIGASPVALGQDMAAQLGACRAIPDNAARLACYDRLSDALVPPPANVAAPQAPPVVPAPSATTPQPAVPVAPPSPAPTPAQRFADDRLPAAKRDAPPELDEIQAGVTALRLVPGGFVEVTLETGQVWRQTDGEQMRVGLGAKVRIRKGLVGGFLLNEVGRNKSYRVKRVE